MKFAIIVFPGSNCDQDAYHAARHVLGQSAEYVWHKDTDLKGADVVVLPGGFAHGDYLRTGAMARFSPIMREVDAFARRGGPLLGICNGFQILQEAGLLPGAMLRNRSVKFLSQPVHVRVERDDTAVFCVDQPEAAFRVIGGACACLRNGGEFKRELAAELARAEAGIREPQNRASRPREGQRNR